MKHPIYSLLLPTLLCAGLWGSAFPVIKSVYTHWEQQGATIQIFDLWLFAGVRFFTAGILVLLFAKQPWQEWRQTPKHWLCLLASSQTLLQYLFFYLGLSFSSGSLAALMASTGSFWWILLAPVFLGTAWPKISQWAVLVLGAIGVSLAVYSPGSGAGSPLLGTLCILISTLFGSIGIITVSKIKPTMSSRSATGFALSLGGMGLCLLGAPAWENINVLFDPYTISMNLWLIFVSAFAFVLWNYLSTIHPVPILAHFRFLIPISGVTQSLLFLQGESAGWGLLIGGTIVIIAMPLAIHCSKRIEIDFTQKPRKL